MTKIKSLSSITSSCKKTLNNYPNRFPAAVTGESLLNSTVDLNIFMQINIDNYFENLSVIISKQRYLKTYF